MRPRANIRTLRDVATPPRRTLHNHHHMMNSPDLNNTNIQAPLHATESPPQQSQPNPTLNQQAELVIPLESHRTSIADQSMRVTKNATLLQNSTMDNLNTSQLFQSQSANDTFVSPSIMTQPQYGEGQIIDLFVTIFPYSPDILQFFYNIGSVMNTIQTSNGGLIIEYSTGIESREALKLNGAMIGNELITVRPTQSTEIPAHFVDELNSRFGQDCLSSLSPNSTLNTSLNTTQQQNNNNNMNTTLSSMNTTSTSAINTTHPIANSIVSPTVLSTFQSPFKKLNQSLHDKSNNNLNTTTTTNISTNTGHNTTIQQQQPTRYHDRTMAIQSPNLQQRRQQPNQQLTCIAPFDIDIVNNKGVNLRSIATYDEHIRNRGCWSKMCDWFSGE